MFHEFARAQLLLSRVGMNPTIIWAESAVTEASAFQPAFVGIDFLARAVVAMGEDLRAGDRDKLNDPQIAVLRQAHTYLGASTEVLQRSLRLGSESWGSTETQLLGFLSNNPRMAQRVGYLGSSSTHVVLCTPDDVGDLAWAVLQAFVAFNPLEESYDKGSYAAKNAAAGLDALEQALINREAGALFRQVLISADLKYTGFGVNEAIGTYRAITLEADNRGLVPAQTVALAALKGAWFEHVRSHPQFDIACAEDQSKLTVALSRYGRQSLTILSEWLVDFAYFEDSGQALEWLISEIFTFKLDWA